MIQLVPTTCNRSASTRPGEKAKLKMCQCERILWHGHPMFAKMAQKLPYVLMLLAKVGEFTKLWPKNDTKIFKFIQKVKRQRLQKVANLLQIAQKY